MIRRTHKWLGAMSFLVAIGVALWCWHCLCHVSYRPWRVDDAPLRVRRHPKEMLPELDWLDVPPRVEARYVVEGVVRPSRYVVGELHLVEDGNATRLSSFAAGHSHVVGRLSFLLVVGCVTAYTSDGPVSVLTVQGTLRRQSGAFLAAEYSPVEPEFTMVGRGRLAYDQLTVVFACGDREPAISDGVTVEQFAAANPLGRFLVGTAGLTRRR